MVSVQRKTGPEKRCRCPAGVDGQQDAIGHGGRRSQRSRAAAAPVAAVTEVGASQADVATECDIDRCAGQAGAHGEGQGGQCEMLALHAKSSEVRVPRHTQTVHGIDQMVRPLKSEVVDRPPGPAASAPMVVVGHFTPARGVRADDRTAAASSCTKWCWVRLLQMTSVHDKQISAVYRSRQYGSTHKRPAAAPSSVCVAQGTTLTQCGRLTQRQIGDPLRGNSSRLPSRAGCSQSRHSTHWPSESMSASVPP